MERKEFLKTCGYACLGSTFLGALLASCSSTRMVAGSISQSGLVVPVSAFAEKGDTFRKYVVVHNDQLKYPICLYRFGAEDYSALLMRCPHQGAELQVFGDRLQCPAHGSEFSNKGVVENGPADTNLRILPVTIQNGQINISLK